MRGKQAGKNFFSYESGDESGVLDSAHPCNIQPADGAAVSQSVGVSASVSASASASVKCRAAWVPSGQQYGERQYSPFYGLISSPRRRGLSTSLKIPGAARRCEPTSNWC
jgi:hypothetical protein